MNEPLKRRSLFPIASSAAPPPPEAIAEVAARNGFPEVTTQPAPALVQPEVPSAGQGAARRRRQPTGRDHQFNTRLRRDTLDTIYSEANERNIPVAQVIEEAIAALQAQRRPS